MKVVGPHIPESRQLWGRRRPEGTDTAGKKSHAELLILCARIGFNP